MLPSRDDARLSASLAASRVLVTSGGNASVAELAESAGISMRTWFRYFPSKTDCIRPMLHETATLTLDIIDQRLERESVCDAFIAAFAAVSGGFFAERTRALLPVVFASEALSAVLSHETERSGERLRDLLIRRFGASADPIAISALAATLPALGVMALRDGVAQGAPPVDLLAQRVEALRLAQLPLSLWRAERNRT